MTDTHHAIIKADQRGRLRFAPDQRAILQRRDRSAGTGNDGPKHRMIFVAGSRMTTPEGAFRIVVAAAWRSKSRALELSRNSPSILRLEA